MMDGEPFQGAGNGDRKGDLMAVVRWHIPGHADSLTSRTPKTLGHIRLQQCPRRSKSRSLADTLHPRLV